MAAEERDLSEEFKLSVRSVPEMDQALARIVANVMREPAAQFRGKRPKRVHVVNAVLCWLHAQPEPAQKRIVAEGMALLLAILRGEGPPAASEIGPAPAPAPAPDRELGDRSSVDPLPPASPRRRRGAS